MSATSPHPERLPLDVSDGLAAGSWRLPLVWALGALYVAAQLGKALSGAAHMAAAFNGAITVTAFMAAIIHGSIRYGWRGITVFAALTILVSNALENLSILTGFPFGHYHYSEMLGPKLFNVPVVIGPAYFSVGYLAWTISNIILDEVDRLHHTMYWLILSMIASFVMVGWDLSMDPLQSTISGYWIWPTGGGYFGVPISNFLGWYITVFLIYALFGFYLRRNPQSIRIDCGRVYWCTAIGLFMSCALPFALSYMLDTTRIVHDARGTPWSAADIGESAFLISLFSIVFAGAMAGAAILRRRPAVKASP